MNETPLAIVLAAGKGTRMKSEMPKVLVEVCGRPMIHYVLDALEAGGVDETMVVVGYGAQDVKSALANRERTRFVVQQQQLGTGHAVMMCRRRLDEHSGPVLVVTGDSPLMQSASIAALLAEFQRDRPACILGTGYKSDPTGFGRIVRDDQNKFVAIVEQKDATPEQRKITEVNLSCYVFDASDLCFALDELRCDNVQGEYYITDCPGILKDHGKEVRALDVLKSCEALSINTDEELAAAESMIENLQKQRP